MIVMASRQIMSQVVMSWIKISKVEIVLLVSTWAHQVHG